MKKGFTIVELLLAITLMAILIVVSGAVFHMAVGAYRTAAATAEITRKLRAVTDQLDADFQGLRKDGEIFIVWATRPVDDDGDGTIDRYERFDRIMFFADGDFQSYNELPGTIAGPVRGDLARITYMLAKDGNDRKAQSQPAPERLLARSQHIFTGDAMLVDDAGPPQRARVIPIDPTAVAATFTDPNAWEYENLTLSEWIHIPWADKREMLAVIADVRVSGSTHTTGGPLIDPEKPQNVHQLLCEGVGQFSVQGWYALQARWFPEVDPNRDGLLDDSDFYVNGSVVDTFNVPGLLYPGDPYGGLYGPDTNLIYEYPSDEVDAAHFAAIPGLGRALKFTFTLYDSHGVFKDGKTFTHIVYLDD